MSEYKYKVSVIIPVYNCEKYIRKCVESLREQTMAYEDFQIIFINDGSPDNSGEICRNYAEADDTIVYFEKENGGVSSARNKGIDLAEGKYLMFLDADDEFIIEQLNDETEDVVESEEIIHEEPAKVEEVVQEKPKINENVDIQAEDNILSVMQKQNTAAAKPAVSAAKTETKPSQKGVEIVKNTSPSKTVGSARRNGQSLESFMSSLKNDQAESKPVEEKPVGDWCAFVTEKSIGVAPNELGGNLMKMYLYTLTQSDNLPGAMLFMNEGVKVLENEEMQLSLAELAIKGVKLIFCGACLNFYGISHLCPPANISNMYVIVEEMGKYNKVVKI